jgi:phosphatidylserine synthase
MVLLSLLMVSTVKYPRFPPIGFKTLKGLFGLTVHLVILVCSLWIPSIFLFPLGLTYLTFGLARHAVLLVLEKHDGNGTAVLETDDLGEARRTSERLPHIRRGRSETGE